MPWVETSRQPPAQYSNLTGFVGFRTFKVWGNINRTLILTDPQQVINPSNSTSLPPGTLPAFDSTWPGFEAHTGATLEQYGVETDGDVLLVTAVYTDRRQRDDFLSSFQTEREEIEFAYRVPIVRPVATPSGIVTPSDINTKGWYTSTIVRYSTWYRMRKTVYVQLAPEQAGDPVSNIDLPIASQVNKIHNLGNASSVTPGSEAFKLFARFEGGDVQRLTWDRFKITYSWTVESGVPWPGSNFSDILRGEIIAGGIAALDPEDFIFPRFTSRLYGGGVGDGQIYLRPPFEQTRSIPRISIDDPANLLPPLFWSFMEFEFDEDGFSGLPGL